MATTPSANMNLPIATVSVEPGPQWAQDINNSLTILDGHNHSPGYGVPINPSGLNINSDLPINNNNLTAARSLRFQPQGSPLSGPSDLGALYESGVDLFYNDGSGNQIRITQGGGIAGTPGSIANLTSPASATYVSATQTFVWQSDANTPANMDAGYFILRNNVANSFALSLFPPNSMGSNFSIVLPTLPAQTNILTIDASGNMGSTLNVDNSSLTISGSSIQIANNGVTTAKIADAQVTRSKLAAVPYQVSASCGAFGTSSGTPVDVTNLSVTITTTGRPVFIGLIGEDQSGSGPTSSSYISTNFGVFYLMRDGATQQFSQQGAGGAETRIHPSGLQFIDFNTGGAGTYTYKLQVANIGSGVFLNFCKMVAYEIA